jgi:hypothetical protein
MIRLYDISTKKTNIAGLWKSDSDKLFKDYINIKLCKVLDQGTKDNLFIEKKQLAIFYAVNNCYAVIEDAQGNKSELKKRKIFQCKRLRASRIKNILNVYGGCTIYHKKNNYLIEVWSKA